MVIGLDAERCAARIRHEMNNPHAAAVGGDLLIACAGDVDREGSARRCAVGIELRRKIWSQDAESARRLLAQP